MELTRSQVIKLGRFCHDVCGRLNGSKPWVTPRRLREAVMEDTNLATHISEDGAGVLLDEQLRADFEATLDSISEVTPPRARNSQRRAELEADLQNPALAKISTSGKMAILYALVAGMKGEPRQARLQEMQADLGIGS